MKSSRIIKIMLLVFAILSLVAILVSCGLGGGKNNSQGNNVNVEDMEVKGEIQGDIFYDPDISKITWEKVNDASYYLVKFGENDIERTVEENSIGINTFSGNNIFYVYAVRLNNTKTAVKTQSFTIFNLSLSLDKSNDSVVWEGNENVKAYHVSVSNMDDIQSTPIKWNEQPGVTSASLSCIPESDCRYSVKVEAEVNKGTILPSSDSYVNIRRVKCGRFIYNGYSQAFTGFSYPIPGENATYTHHVIFNDEDHTFTGSSYVYIPTGGSFTATTYTESDRANYLNSKTQTINVIEKPTVTNISSDENGVLTWDAVDGVSSYRVLVNGTMKANTQETTFNAASLVGVGNICEISISPFFSENAYSSVSNTIHIFRRGSALTLTFNHKESAATYGQIGDNNFTATGAYTDTEIKGVVFNVIGPTELENDTFNADFIGDGRSINSKVLHFETPGDYTITITPRYELPLGVICLGTDSSDSYTVTRLAPLSSAEARYENNAACIYVTGATNGHVAVTNTTDQLVSTSTQTTAYYKSVYVGNNPEGVMGLIETQNNLGTKMTYTYKLYNVPVVNKNDNQKVATLRSLSGIQVSYKLVGTVDNIRLLNTNDGIQWDYGETDVSYKITDTSDRINITQSESSLDLSSQIESGVFNDGGNHRLYISVVPDYENKIFSPTGLVSFIVQGKIEPSLQINTTNSNIENLIIFNNSGQCTIETTYAIGPYAGQTRTEAVLTLTENHAGATIRIRNNGGKSIKGNNFLNSPWVTYTVEMPTVINTSIICNADKTISWTAVEHISRYKYVISGDGDASADNITITKTSSIASILSGKKTFSITISGYGSQDGNVFYLPREILTDTFYCSSLEVYALNNGVSNTATSNSINQTNIQFQVTIVPTGSPLTYSSCSVAIKDSNEPTTIYYNSTAYTNSVYDCTSIIETRPTGNTFKSHMNKVGYRHANITFSLPNNAESTLLQSKSFIDKSSVVFALYKGYNDQSKYDIYYTSSN